MLSTGMSAKPLTSYGLARIAGTAGSKEKD